MSRILGIKGDQRRREWDSQLDTMLAISQSAHDWQQSKLSCDSAWLAWTGWQSPNVEQHGSVSAVVDGRFFNRTELPAGRSDAQRLIHLYREYGFVQALQRINGDFAVALFDESADKLWIARDRIGIKPLYYCQQDDWLAWSSRPKALLSLPGVPADVDRRFVATFAASHYRYFDNDPDASPYQAIGQVPAAHALCFSRGQLTHHRYWALEEMPDWTETEDELAQRYQQLLLDSVAIRVDGTRSPAFMLSGGMDSSSVLASAVHVTGQRQHAFSTVYVDKTYDESEEIKTILEETVQQWHQVMLETPDLISTVQQMIAVHDEPIATATWLSHYLLCQQAARQGFGELFGGLGGDELNAGEYEYFHFHFADLKRTARHDQLASEIEHWARYHDHPIYRKSFESAQRDMDRLVDLNHPGRCLPDPVRMNRYAAALNRDYFQLDEWCPVMEHPFQSYLKNRTYQDMTRETAPCCLRAEDRQSTAFGLDHLLPFFDYRLVEFMFRVPGTLKIRDGVTKVLLRQATRGILPDETRTRIKKTGWNAPAHVWFSGEGLEPLMDLVHSQNFRERGIYEVDQVMQIIDQHQQIVQSGAAQENHMMFLWQLVNLELWMQSIEHPIAAVSA